MDSYNMIILDSEIELYKECAKEINGLTIEPVEGRRQTYKVSYVFPGDIFTFGYIVALASLNNQIHRNYAESGI